MLGFDDTASHDPWIWPSFANVEVNEIIWYLIVLDDDLKIGEVLRSTRVHVCCRLKLRWSLSFERSKVADAVDLGWVDLEAALLRG